MSNGTPTPDSPDPKIPKPNIPSPSIPKPNVPKPNIPSPNLEQPVAAPPVSTFESGAMETTPPPSQEEAFNEEPTVIKYTETLFPQRIISGVIDYVIAGILLAIATWALSDFLGLAANGLAMAYLLFKDSLPFFDGQSVGKKITKIKAVTQEGTPLTKDIKAGLIRNVFAAIPILAIVEIFILNSREKAENSGLRLGDDFAKTKVISVAPSEEPSQKEETA